MMSLFSDDCHYTVLGSTYSQSDYISVCSPPSRPPLATYTIPISCNSNIFIISTQHSEVEQTKFNQNVDLGHILNNNIDKLEVPEVLWVIFFTHRNHKNLIPTQLDFVNVECSDLPASVRVSYEREPVWRDVCECYNYMAASHLLCPSDKWWYS